ncbi:MAG: hypothetical protein RL173_2090 [Fibrobacterota bacterium]|jgi:hypothetical protein
MLLDMPATVSSSSIRSTALGAFLRFAAPPILQWRDRRPIGHGEIRQAQARILKDLLDQLAPTARGRDLGLQRVSRHREANLRMALRDLPIEQYEDISPYIDRCAAGESDVLFPGRAVALAQTSGTTSGEGTGERYIPQSRRLLAHHARGGAAALSRLAQLSGPEIFGGRMLMLGGSTNLVKNQSGIPSGDLSGITVSRIPWFLSPLYEPGRKLAMESDWTAKVNGIASRLSRSDVRLVTGIPSWCQVLFQQVCHDRNCQRVSQAWPGLKAFVHGGVSVDPYLPMLREHLSPDTWMMEVYPASEAFIAVGSRPWRLSESNAPDLELLSSHGVYLEFLREDLVDRPELAVGAEDLECGAIYRVLLTTPGGLVRHQIGDLVEGRGPGQIRFAGRIKARISVFGEHVEGARLAEALAEACQVTDSVVREWHVAPVLPTGSDPRGRHEWWIEFERPPSDPYRFEAILDEVLQCSVLDYQAHRAGNVQLLAPVVRMLPAGTFHEVLKRRGKLGGQHKVPVAWTDRTWADQLTLCAGETA